MLSHDLLARVGVAGGVMITLTRQDPLPLWQFPLGPADVVSGVPRLLSLINTFPISPSQ